MNITFMIGNGFDLRLGMHTRYADAYKSYINQISKSPVIEKFKEELRKSAPDDFRTWADFEMSMADYGANFNSEEEFVSCVRDFKMCLAEHLLAEERKIEEFFKNGKDANGDCMKEMTRSLLGFYRGQDQNTVRYMDWQIQNGMTSLGFLTFNYTGSLDYVLDKFKDTQYFGIRRVQAASPLHIHGKLNEDMVLGVDNIGQLSKVSFPITRKGERAFIKPSFNKMYDNNRVMQAQSMIEQSDAICIYGMSLGESDLTWIRLIKKWLLENSDHHLFYFVYSTKVFNTWMKDEIMDEEDDLREKLIKKIMEGVPYKDNLVNQVHIPVGYDIFDFKNKVDQIPKIKAAVREMLQPVIANSGT